MPDSPFLSIVVPFHNSATKCAALLGTLLRVERGDGIELILVDDGSTDDTLHILRDFARSARADVCIVERDHGGPGAARNSGLDRASGRFVWFVDSDDDIDLAAVEIARGEDWANIDLIAWDWTHPDIRRTVPAGRHAITGEPAPPDALDPIVANWLSMDFVRRVGLRFPENCVFEATPLEAFVLPLLLSRYTTRDFAAYKGSIEHASVTRGERFDPRLYDRLETVSLGRAFVQQASLSPAARRAFDAAFVRLFLWYSIRLSKLPDRSWLLAARVMRKFRDEARRFGITGDPFDHYPGRTVSRIVLRFLWALSAALPAQDSFFERLHLRVWGRPILWNPPEMPARWKCGSKA